MQVVFPAGVEEFPLQVSHLNQLGALLLLHARVFKRHEECRNESSPGVAQIVKQIERFFRVGVRLAGQANDKSTERKPVMLVQRFHALQHDVAPLMGFIRIGFSLHEDLEETWAASLQTDDRIGHPMIGIGRLIVLNV